jgi:hypothetical protein
MKWNVSKQYFKDPSLQLDLLVGVINNTSSGFDVYETKAIAVEVLRGIASVLTKNLI